MSGRNHKKTFLHYCLTLQTSGQVGSEATGHTSLLDDKIFFFFFLSLIQQHVKLFRSPILLLRTQSSTSKSSSDSHHCGYVRIYYILSQGRSQCCFLHRESVNGVMLKRFNSALVVITWDSSSSRSSIRSRLLFQLVSLTVSVSVLLWLTLWRGGLLDIVSEPLNSTWQGVAPSYTANVTAPPRSQTCGGSENNESSRLVFDIKDDILLIFFLLSSLVTSLIFLILKGLAGYLLVLVRM